MGVVGIGILLAQSVVVRGPSIRLSPAAGKPGYQAETEIVLDFPAGKEPLGLQWKVVVPAGQLSLDAGVEPGAAAKAAGKALRCGRAKNEGANRTAVCILSGGPKPVPNGTVALLKLRIEPNAKPGVAKVRIENALGRWQRFEKASRCRLRRSGITIREE